MIDPFTAMAAVSTAVKLIKKASATVDDVKSLGPLLGRYFDAKQTAVKAVREAKKVGGSNMGKAIELEMALKSQADFESELQMLFMTTGNIDVWNSIQARVQAMDANDKLEERREKTRALNRKRREKELIETAVLSIILVALMAGAGWALVEGIQYCKANTCST